MIIANHDFMCLPFFIIFLLLHINVAVLWKIIGRILVYGNLCYTFILFLMKTKCKFLVEENKDILLMETKLTQF